MIKLNEKHIQGQNFPDFLESNCNLMKIAVTGFEEIIKTMYEDMEKFKSVSFKKPDKKTALALLEYLNLKNPQVEEIIKTLCETELQKYLNWIDDYCKEYKYSRELVLKRISEGEI